MLLYRQAFVLSAYETPLFASPRRTSICTCKQSSRHIELKLTKMTSQVSDTDLQSQDTPERENTRNKTGYTYNRVDSFSIAFWLESLPNSSKPLLDLGAAYGVHTIHAMRHGRDVIASDMDAGHIDELQKRVDKALNGTNNGNMGSLISTSVAELPCSDVVPTESVSGVLISEVIHFLRPGEPLKVFRDIYRWLEPGGRVVSTSASQVFIKKFTETSSMKLQHGRTAAEALSLIENASEDELLDLAPGYMELLPGSKAFEFALGRFYPMSLRELKVLAQKAGFEVERVEYFSPQKYPLAQQGSFRNEGVLLVARKPMEGSG